MIPCSNPKAQYLAHRSEIDAAIARVLGSGWYIHGPEVRAFESEFAAFVGARHALGVGSGTEALHVALVACGVGPGDEVITVSHTAVATVSAIELAGGTPVLVDIDPETFTMDPVHFSAAITPRTKAVVAVHLYGHPADLDAIISVARESGIRVIEDCAQAHGARYRGRSVGAIADVGCFSFYPTKNLGALGDGGMVVSSDDAIATQVRLLREYGWRERYISEINGWNSRLDELQAAVLRERLKHLDAGNARRRVIADRYDLALGEFMAIPARRADIEHVFHLYVVRDQRREDLQEHLRARGVGTLVHYPMPIHRQPGYAARVRCGPLGLAATERAAGEVLSLPMYPELRDDEVDVVVSHIREFMGSRRTRAALPV